MSEIQIIPYDNGWRERFEEERLRLVVSIGDLLEDVHFVTISVNASEVFQIAPDDVPLILTGFPGDFIQS
jgi:GrpB-like predicted nucleotidyltransferase (UPF0157 family)